MTITIQFHQLGTMTNEQYALAMVRAMQLQDAFPPASVPVTAPSASYTPSGASIKEHPLCVLYKKKTNEGRASVSTLDAQRFASYTVQKGIETPLDVKIAVWKGRLLERGLATSEEIENAISSATGATFNEETETQAMEGDAERGMDLL